MHNAAVQPAYPLPRPPKRRRRTATSVLAGDFDPLPRRDFFTDMANSNDPHNPYSSVIGHGPGILFDIRSRHEKDAALAHEQRRLFKNAKRKERDIEARRAHDEKLQKNVSKRAIRMRETVQVNTAYTAENPPASGSMPALRGGTAPLPPLLARGAAAHPPRDVSAYLPSPQAGPSVTWSPHYTTPHWSVPPLQPVHMAPTLAISVPQPPAQLPNSPPTPSRSVSSYTSRTSSKRLRTPDDDEMLPGVARMQLDSPLEFQMYDSTGNIYSPHTDSPGGIARDKGPAPKLSSAGGSPAWFSNEPLRDMLPETNWETPQPGPSYFEPPPAPPQSTAHRRHALSVAALLSPSTPHATISRPAPAPEPQPQPCAGQTQVAESVRSPPNQTPEPIMAAAPTIEPSCVSPLADTTSLDGDLVYEIPALSMAPADELPKAVDKPLVGEMPAASFVMEEPVKEQSPPADPECDKTIQYVTADSGLREESVPPEFNKRDKGRASKAMLVIESEDELTDSEQLPSPSRPRKHKSKALAPAFLLGVSPEIGNIGSTPSMSMSPGPASIRAPRKRPAVRKGWKGWVEVEVEDEIILPAKSLSVEPPLTLGERRTRSGRHFDA